METKTWNESTKADVLGYFTQMEAKNGSSKQRKNTEAETKQMDHIRVRTSHT